MQSVGSLEQHNFIIFYLLAEKEQLQATISALQAKLKAMEAPLNGPGESSPQNARDHSSTVGAEDNAQRHSLVPPPAPTKVTPSSAITSKTLATTANAQARKTRLSAAKATLEKSSTAPKHTLTEGIPGDRLNGQGEAQQGRDKPQQMAQIIIIFN